LAFFVKSCEPYELIPRPLAAVPLTQFWTSVSPLFDEFPCEKSHFKISGLGFQAQELPYATRPHPAKIMFLSEFDTKHHYTIRSYW
jgi:hypothetical protein